MSTMSTATPPSPAGIDLDPLLQMLGFGAALALLALGWLLWRHRGAGTPQRLRALTLDRKSVV